MVKFIYWLKTQVKKEVITEKSAAVKLEEFYQEKLLSDLESFLYKNKMQNILGLVLLDTGGQYLEGTTDITRTVALGPLTEEEKRYFTLVLRGNLNLGAAKFNIPSSNTALASFSGTIL